MQKAKNLLFETNDLKISSALLLEPSKAYSINKFFTNISKKLSVILVVSYTF